MSDSVFLHVGLPKSGTSHIQQMLTAHKQRLQQAGVLFPGNAWVDQVRAVRDVRRLRVGPGRRGEVRGAWDRLVAEISEWPSQAVVSMEWLGPARPEHIRRMTEDLDPARVHVIFTVRDLARTVPAAWQEFMQNRGEWTWEQFLDGVVARDLSAGSPGSWFWAQQDIEALLGNWVTVVPREQVHVVTLPHPGAGKEVLWQRMCTVLGINSEDYPLGELSSNQSLGLESAELMRRLNRHARESGLRESLYHQVLKHQLAKGALAERTQSSKLVLPPAFHDWARNSAAQQIAGLESSGVNIVGDLQELKPVLDLSPRRQPADVPDEVLLEIALDSLVALAHRWGGAKSTTGDPDALITLRKRLDKQRARVEELQGQVRHFQRRPGRAALGAYARSARARMAARRRS